jgi:RNA polymerase sigma-70 factor (ECF subfamily)
MPHSAPAYATADDRVLVTAVLNHDAEAFRFLIRRYERLVIHMVFRMVRNEADREDLCQDIFIRVYDKLHTFRFESKLSTWIARVAYNACAGFLQRKKLWLWGDWKHTGENDEDEPHEEWSEGIAGSHHTPEVILEKDERRELLEKHVKLLKPTQQTVLLLFHQDDLPMEEIAEVTGLPLNTVKSHLFRARKLLREKLMKELNQ